MFENDEEYNSTTEIDGYTYFLEVNLISKIIQVWSYARNGKTPTLQQKCEAVIYYAKNDAYLPITFN
ncbi:DUF7716 domain-containing protein [Runella salmonicolor]|uniref:DUF7716 domain-containing protein n=1 Tax=Runella salmonicolor TaxID=2950278 RepID=UPI0040445C6F